MKEFRIFGPPGSGKTSALATKYVPGSIKKFGRDKIMITSFTRTAAREIAVKRSRETGENIGLPNSHVGTLHQICYHALNEPVIAETDKNVIAQWNHEYPSMAISSKSMSSMDDLYIDEEKGEISEYRGDAYLAAANIRRNRLNEMWLSDDTPDDYVTTFYKRWTKFKSDQGVLDFTDLIDQCLKSMPYAPDRPEVLYVDEAQDFTPLQLALCRRWAQEMQFMVLVGDDDQALYSFTGATPDAFLNPPLPDHFKEILHQSWRVPLRVHQRSQELVSRIRRREPKLYLPRFDPKTGKVINGQVINSNATWKKPDKLMESILKDFSKQRTIMILGSCKYMINPIRKLLKEYALPFGNPYRKKRADWNPLNNRSTRIVSAFMGNGIDVPYWNIPQFLEWAEHIKVDDENGLKRKKGRKGILFLKDAVLNQEEGLHTVRDVIGQLLAPNAVKQALDRNIEWFKEYLKQPYKNSIDYPIRVYAQHGAQAIEDSPLITLGTIHSVKGGESESVILFPDISTLANKEYYSTKNPDGHDSILRVFYVGMTRAREKLTLCKPAVFAKRLNKREYMYINL